MGLQRLYVDPRENHSAFSLVPGKQNLVLGRSSAGGNFGQGFLERSTGLFRDGASQGMSFDNFLKISGEMYIRGLYASMTMPCCLQYSRMGNCCT
jgi:hypothetical protein